MNAEHDCIESIRVFPHKLLPIGRLVILLHALTGLLTGCGGGPSDDGGVVGNDSVLQDSLTAAASATDLDDFPKRQEWIDHYGSMPSRCITRRDQLDGTRAVFHGCYDWHSSVHGHWAMLRMDMAGSGQYQSHANKVDRRLAAAELQKVKTELDADIAYEMPYGRAWFLRLAGEHGQWARKRGRQSPDRMRVVGDHVAQGIMSFYESRTPSPTSSDYSNDSWALAQLLSWYRFTADNAGLDKVQRMIADHYVTSPMTWDRTNDTNPNAFFSWYWGWVYVIALALPTTEVIDLVNPADIPNAALTPVADPGVASDVHHLGLNWSRAWAIRALARHVIQSKGASDPVAQRLVRAYHEHVHAGRERHFRYRGDYYAYDHWVPQFALYAITD